MSENRARSNDHPTQAERHSVRLSRRTFLARAGALGATALGGVSLLTACGGAPAPAPTVAPAPAVPSPTTAPAARPAAAAPTTAPAAAPTTAPAAAPSPVPAATAVREPTGTINVGLAADSRSLDPTRGSGIEGRQILLNAYDALVRFAPTSFEVQPALAESWQISPDGLVYTFKLRQNAKFWDGAPVTSDAVKFTIERQIDKNSPGYQYSGRAGRLSVVDRIEAPDEYTFRMTLKEPNTPLLHFMTDRMGYVLQPKTALELKDDFGQKGMGAGAFKIDSFQRNVRTAMSANPNYWGEKPKVKNLNFVVIPEPQAQVAALRSGQVDLIYHPDPDLLPTLETDPNIALQRVVGSHAAYLCLNFKFKAFQDVRVRKAIDLAINKQAIADTILKGVAVVAKTPLSQAYGEYYLKDFPAPTFDPKKAKALLEEAGYGSGLDLRLINATNSPGNIKSVEQVTAIQADLAAIGVRVKIENYDTATHYDLEQKQPNSYELTLSSFSSVIGDPDNFLYGVFSSFMWPTNGWNYSYYKNEQVDKLLVEARRIQDVKRRLEIYTQVQKTAVDEVAHVLLNHQVFSMAVNKKVKGFFLHPNLNFIFQGASVG
ncbi:MAG: ABC transporter substrate-binding protein [Chloroflexi bacterium]|nr:ABC transporter substrate-binding protein [Chloroflexota bacterium]